MFGICVVWIMFWLLSDFKDDEVVLCVLCFISVPERPCLVLVFWDIVMTTEHQSGLILPGQFPRLFSCSNLTTSAYCGQGFSQVLQVFNSTVTLKKPPSVGFIMRKRAETGSLTFLRSPPLKHSGGRFRTLTAWHPAHASRHHAGLPLGSPPPLSKVEK